MKLLLTSCGITNESIKKALFDLVGKKPEDINLCFIPTASNMEKGDKTWLIDDLINLKKMGLKSIEITDFTATTSEIYLNSFKNSDVIVFEGGNTAYLMTKLIEFGLDEKLKEILKDKVYVGISAGSMVTNKDLNIKTFEELYNEDFILEEEIEGLNYVDFYFIPHLNSSYFEKVRKENIEKIFKKIQTTIYALDDDSALKIIDNDIEIISEGKYLVFKK